ncbi:MAG: phosphoglycerate dehydrogenase [Actinobacteria bacterium]|nr:phosphoglycerate dehydrogenase [Actinomycetota bacterium]
MARVLVTEEIAERGLDRLRAAGHHVDIQLGLNGESLIDALRGAQALIVRSATNVDAAVFEAVSGLLVVGRAGVGLDNVDVDAATRAGVMVANAPESNIVSAAEHTIALLLAMARNVPQAHSALVAGRWERSKWEGVELAGKTLGIVGLGRIGKLVAHRAIGLGMKIVAYDPYISAERGRQLNVDMLPLDQLVAASDFLTVHLPKNKETRGLINRDLLLKAKPELRVINVARGGIVVESDLAEALRDGIIAGAALDVFEQEPVTDSALFSLPNVVVTPHLGASTREAQDKAGEVIADMVQLALAGDFVPFAVNVNASEANETLKPFIPLAERLGALFADVVGERPTELEVEASGDIGAYDTRILTLAALKGFLGRHTSEAVTYVNAPTIAESRGVVVREQRNDDVAHQDYVNLVTLRSGAHNVSGTLTGRRREARIVLIDDHLSDVPPAKFMLIVRNDDRPGVIGRVGTLLGDSGINIDNMDVGKTVKAGSAMMVIATATPTPAEVVQRLRGIAGITEVITVGSPR